MNFNRFTVEKFIFSSRKGAGISMKKHLLITVLSLMALSGAAAAQTAGDRGVPGVNSTSQTSFETLIEQANEYYLSEEYDAAAPLLERALKIQPKNAPVHFRLGNCYIGIKQYKKAIQSFREALNIKPDYYEAVVYLGNALDYDGQFEQAIETYKKAIQMKPDDWQPHYELGIAQYNQKLFVDAANSFRETIKRGDSIGSKIREETLARSNYFMGDSFRLSKNFTAAIKAYQDALKIDDEMEMAYYGLGMAYVGIGNSSGARQQYEKLRGMNRELAYKLLSEISKIQLAT
jgi:tetratricopeptide (TPR) repeat protein